MLEGLRCARHSVSVVARDDQGERSTRGSCYGSPAMLTLFATLALLAVLALGASLIPLVTLALLENLSSYCRDVDRVFYKSPETSPLLSLATPSFLMRGVKVDFLSHRMRF